MWILDQLFAVCVSLGLGCTEDLPKPAVLPDDEARAWAYTPRPEPTPTPAVPAITLTPPEPRPEPIQTVINIQPPEPKPEPKPKPVQVVIDPALVASQKLLAQRRLSALEGGLPEIAMSDTSGSLDIPSAPAQSTPLGINSVATQERYSASGLDSGLPVDNTRIITETEPIPVILREAINSQIPSKVVLRVERNIYGSHGRKILIPKFSEIVCKHATPDHANSSRLEMQCSRIIAAGKRYEINGLGVAVADQQGQGGVTGSVDKRFWERYGTAFMLTGISTAVKVASGVIPSTTENPNLVSAATQGAEELSQKFGEITAKVLEETVSLKPIIRIAQGTRMSLSLGNDWYIAEVNTGTGEKT